MIRRITSWCLPALLALFLSGCGGLHTGAAPASSGEASPAPTGRDKGFASSQSTREVLEASFAPRRIAVVVGLNRYADATFQTLKWAERDAQEFARVLSTDASGGFDRVVTLIGESQARRDRILAEMISLRNDLRRQDSLVVFVSTHGTMTLDEEGQPSLFLVAHDTQPGNLRGTAIELGELQRFFSDIKAERKALILDACYNGQDKSALQPTLRQRISKLEEAPVLSRTVRLGQSEAHLFASTFGRPAREDDELQHGVYTYHLLDSLTWNQLEADANGDGLVTVYEAHDHARAKTISWTTGTQVPEAYFRLVGRNDLVLVGSPEVRNRAETALLFYYGPEGDAFDGATLLVDGQEKGHFPGTFSLTAGRHHVQVIGTDGSVLHNRTILLSSDQPLAANGVQDRPAYYNGFLSVGPKVRFGLTDNLRPLTGRAHVGVEANFGYRFLRGAPGLTLSGILGYAPHQARFDNGDSPRFEARHVVSFGGGLGYRVALRRGTLTAGYRLRAMVLSPLQDASCGEIPACGGWLYLVHGLALDQSLSLGRRWSLRFEEEVGLSAVDPLGKGVGVAVDLSFLVGVEVGL